MTWLESRFGSAVALLVILAAAANAALLGVKMVTLSAASKVFERFARLRRLPREESPVELTVADSGDGMVKNLETSQCQETLTFRDINLRISSMNHPTAVRNITLNDADTVA
jgi:hypothetical protein